MGLEVEIEVKVEVEVKVEDVLSTVHPRLDNLSHSTMVLLLHRCSESKEASNQTLPASPFAVR